MNKIKAISILLVTFFLAISCNRNDDGGDNTQTGAKQINNFVWKGLNSWYYWQKDVANLSDNFGNSNQYVNYVNSKNPDDLFYGLLYDYPNTDRFSWIVDDVEALQQQFSGISKDSGMNLSLSENGYYQIDVDLKYKSYLITAKAINVQTSDSECKIITLDNTGQKGGTSGQACW